MRPSVVAPSPGTVKKLQKQKTAQKIKCVTMILIHKIHAKEAEPLDQKSPEVNRDDKGYWGMEM